jgi:putative hydrolase of the HAD superfamily
MKKIIKIDVDGVIFDLGSTLIEYENIPWSQLNLDCLKAGYSFLESQKFKIPSSGEFMDSYLEIRGKYRDEAGKTLKEWKILDAVSELLQSAGFDGDIKLRDGFFAAYFQPVISQTTIFDDTLDVLNKLRKSGKRVGLVSNTIFPEDYHRRDLKRFGLEPYIDFAIFSSSFGYRKPHPAIYEEATRQMGIEKSRLVFVGDRYIEDYAGPRESGLHAILRFRQDREYPEPLANSIRVVYSLSELLSYLGD